MTPEEEKIRAEDAGQLLRHPVLVAALRDIEVRLIDALGQFDTAPERALRLQGALAGKRSFERMLKNYVQTGQLVIEDERRRSLGDRAKKLFRQ